jgi:cytochrome c553
MKRFFWIPCALALLMTPALLTTGCGAETASASAAAVKKESPAERGRYLVTAMGCGDCHSPKKITPQGPVEDTSRLLSGHPEGTSLPTPPAATGPWIASASWDQTAWAGPWGITYATNLTPDQNTGLGIWTEDMFVTALKAGRHMGASRPILPPMPWQALSHLSDSDLRAIYAYLKTLPRVHNRVPDPALPATATAAR